VFKGAIFDLDGVIVETVPLHFKAWKKMFSEYGRGFTFEEYKEKVDGIPRVDGARAVLKGLSYTELEEASARKQKYYLELLEKEGVTVYSDTLGLITILKQKGKPIAVISSSKNCFYVLEKAGIENLFDAIIGGHDLLKGKPDPDIFLIAAKRLGCKPEECAIFEDAVLGVEAGRRGGFVTVGIDRYNNPERLGQADLVVSDFSELDFNKLNALFNQ